MVSIHHFQIFPAAPKPQEQDIASLYKQQGAKLKLDSEFIQKLCQLSLLHSSPDYQVQLDQLSKEISPDMIAPLTKMGQSLCTHVVAKKTLEGLLDAARVRQKWSEFGFKSEWLDANFQDAAFLLKTKLIFSIVGFQNSTLKGLKKNEIKIQPIPNTDYAGLWIKKGGSMGICFRDQERDSMAPQIQCIG